MGDWYNGGTLAVESGSASIVGTTTLFATKIKEGDTLLTLQSDTLRLNQVTAIADDNSATIDPVWAGDTATGLAYYVIPTSRLWGEVSTAARDLSNFLANIATFFPTDGKPADDEGGDGSFAIDPNSTPPKLYVKTSGTWDSGTSLGGPTGATGAGYGGTSSDSKTLANTGSMSFTTQAGLAWQTGSRIRVASAAAPTTKWMEGVVTSYSSTTLIITIDKQGSGSGSASDWTFSSAGIPGEKGDKGDTGATGSTGATGTAGAGYGATSTTSRAIASTGTMSWTIGTGKAYQVGDLVKITVSTDVTQWMKGKVSSYTAGSLAVDVSESNGSGTYASWNIGLAGETGVKGDKGDKGDTGSAGADGSILTATSATSLTTATGSKIFTLAATADFIVGQRLRAASSSDVTNWMSGIVTAFDSGTLALTLNVDQIGSGAGTASDWNIALTGEKGDQGPAGGFATLSPAKGNLISGDGVTYGAVTPGGNGSVLVADSTAPRGLAWRFVARGVNAVDYGVVADGSTDDTAAFQAAVNDAISKKVALFLPAGTINISAEISVPSPVTIVGFGPYLSTIALGSATQNGFNITTTGSVNFSDFAISATGTQTAGAGVLFNSGTQNYFSRFTNILFNRLYTGLDFDGINVFVVEKCMFVECTGNQFKIINTNDADAGDGLITGCLFQYTGGVTSNNVLLYWQSSGGLKVVGSKFLGGYRSIHFDLRAGAGTGSIVVGVNSIENFTDTGIRIDPQTSGPVDGVFNKVAIAGNEIGGFGDGIPIKITASSTPAWCDTIAISGNIIATSIDGTGTSAQVGVDIDYCSNVSITGNPFKGYNDLGTGIKIGSNASNIARDNSNTFIGFATNVLDASTSRPIRERLTANRTYYVRADGSNSNHGLTNTSGGAFLTIGKAVNAALALDLGGFNVTIQVGAGTYGSFSAVSPQVGAGTIAIVGDTTTPSNCVISAPSTCILAQGGCVLEIRGFKLTSSGGYGMQLSDAGTKVTLGAMEYGSVGSTARHIYASSGSFVIMNANYTISAGAQNHILADKNSNIEVSGLTITLTNTPAWAGSFIDVQLGAAVRHFSCTFSGSATGPRYSVTLAGVIQTFGAASSYFPGNSAGTATLPGAIA